MSKIIERNTMVVDKNLRELHIRNKLPQIVVPADKVDAFIDWWNKDIRFQQEIPHSFDEGYLILNNTLMESDVSKFAPMIKILAKEFKSTYRNIENQLKDFIANSQLITLYFVFSDNNLKVYMYGPDKKIITSMSLDIGEGEPEPEIPDLAKTEISWEEYQNTFNISCVDILITVLWYLATSSNKKYYYERSNDKSQNINSTDKKIVKVKKYKTISTPIYDLNKVKSIKVETCIKHRKGWTYSHSFQVHGHYRHYKNGKVIFVKSYIKGQNKEFKQQTIIVEPKG